MPDENNVGCVLSFDYSMQVGANYFMKVRNVTFIEVQHMK